MSVTRRLTVVLLGLSAVGCNQLLDVPDTNRVPATVLDDPALAVTLIHGAVADFECALADYIVLVGLLTDELYSSANEGPVNAWDRRVEYQGHEFVGCVPSNNVGIGVYIPLQTARFQAEDGFRRIESFPDMEVPPPGRSALLATAAAYAGYSYTLIGEGFCEAAFDEGPALDWREVLETAEQRFTTAINLAQSSGLDSILHMARVGRARVRLDLDNPVGAASDARLVDSGFVKYATYSTANERRKNRMYRLNEELKAVSVDPRYRYMTVGGVPDPRVTVLDAGLGPDGVTPLVLQTKYSSASSPITIASWDEAQLIIAEAEGGQSAIDAINALRAQVDPLLPAFASNDPVEIMRHVARERRVELFMEGHRLNDRLRLQGPLGVPPTVVCPDCYTNLAQDSLTLGLALETGVTHRGLPFGDLSCLRLPAVEIDNNPNLHGHDPKTKR